MGLHSRDRHRKGTCLLYLFSFANQVTTSGAFRASNMGSSKLLILLAFLGVALTEAKVVPVGLASATIQGCVINCHLGRYLQHPSDCTKFIQCAPTGPEVHSCPRTTIWDQTLLTCNHDSSIACETGKYLTLDGKPCPEETTEQPPTRLPITEAPTEAPITHSPTEVPTKAPTTQAPTEAATTQSPTEKPTSQPPTKAPSTHPPTEVPTTQPPTAAPTTQPPTEAPKTQPPTAAPTTQPPTEAPTTQPPTKAPTTKSTTKAPTTQPPTAAPTTHPHTKVPPTQLPTEVPTKQAPSEEPTKLPPTEAQPTTVAPIIPTTKGDDHFKCPKKFGKFAHPSDCNRYFACKFWHPKEYRCPFGLYFNDRLNECTLPVLSGCKASEKDSSESSEEASFETSSEEKSSEEK